MSKIIYIKGLYFEHKDLRDISVVTKVGVKTKKGKTEEIVWKEVKLLVNREEKVFTDTFIWRYPGICGKFNEKMQEMGLNEQEIMKARLREIEIAEQASKEEIRELNEIMEGKSDEI